MPLKMRTAKLPEQAQILWSAAICFIIATLPLGAAAGSLKITGPYANRFSAVDLEQIKVLISKAPNVDRRLRNVDAVSTDKLHIRTGGRTAVDLATYFDFDVYKRAGRWSIDSKSIEIATETIEQPNSGQILIR